MSRLELAIRTLHCEVEGPEMKPPPSEETADMYNCPCSVRHSEA
jgi:hypothetical protein